MNVNAKCDDLKPHKHHTYDLPPHPSVPHQKVSAYCDGVPWPTITPADRCTSIMFSEGSPLFGGDAYYMCARSKNHPVDARQREYHCTSNFGLMWASSPNATTKPDCFLITIEVPAESFMEAQAVAEQWVAEDVDNLLVEIAPAIKGSRVVL